MHRSAQFGNRASDLARALWEQSLVLSVYYDRPNYQNLLSIIKRPSDSWHAIDSFLVLPLLWILMARVSSTPDSRLLAKF
jgi:hypothetical protein